MVYGSVNVFHAKEGLALSGLLIILSLACLFVRSSSNTLCLCLSCTTGTVVVFVIPTLMFCRAIERKRDSASPSQRREVYLAKSLMAFGILMGVIGVLLAVKKH